MHQIILPCRCFGYMIINSSLKANVFFDQIIKIEKKKQLVLVKVYYFFSLSLKTPAESNNIYNFALLAVVLTNFWKSYMSTVISCHHFVLHIRILILPFNKGKRPTIYT